MRLDLHRESRIVAMAKALGAVSDLTDPAARRRAYAENGIDLNEIVAHDRDALKREGMRRHLFAGSIGTTLAAFAASPAAAAIPVTTAEISRVSETLTAAAWTMGGFTVLVSLIVVAGLLFDLRRAKADRARQGRAAFPLDAEAAARHGGGLDV